VRLGERTGVTTVRFFGRVAGRPLPQGTYALVVRRRTGERISRLAILRVRIVRRRHAPPAVVRLPGRPPACKPPTPPVLAPAVAASPDTAEVAGARRNEAPPPPPAASEPRTSFVARAVDSFRQAPVPASPWVMGLLVALVALVLLTITLALLPPRLVPIPPLARALSTWRTIRRG
jgi:hypothetical protein